jgi:hypothetical protein
MEYPNLTACGARIAEKCKGCTNLARHETSVRDSLRTSCREMDLMKKVTAALLDKARETDIGEGADLIQEAGNDQIKESLKFAIRNIVSQVNQANNIQSDCVGAWREQSGNTCHSNNI